MVLILKAFPIPQIRWCHLQHRRSIYVIVNFIIASFLAWYVNFAILVLLGEDYLIVEGRGKPLVILHLFRVDLFSVVHIHLGDADSA